MAENNNRSSHAATSGLIIGNYSLLRKLDGEVWEALLPVTIYMAILIVLGIIGNSLVIFIWCKKMKPSSTNVCVLLLAFFDLLTCVLGMPLDIYDLSIQNTSNNAALCKVSRFLIDVSVYGSITVLVFIAILRYVKVCRPLAKFPVKSRGITIISLGLGIGLSWPVLVLHGLEIRFTRIPGIGGRGCGIDEHLKGSLYQNIFFSALAFIFVASCVLLTVLYALIALHIFRQNQRRRSGAFGMSGEARSRKGNDNNEKSKTESKPFSNRSFKPHNVSKNSLMFFVITLAFVVSFLPSMIMLAIKAKTPHIESTLTDWQYAAYMFLFRTYFINNCINPILYGFWNRRFREESVKLMTNCRLGCQTNRLDTSVSANQSFDKPVPACDKQVNNNSEQPRPPSRGSIDLSVDFSDADIRNSCHIPDESIHRVAKSKFYTQEPNPTPV